jgi:hypothetical protein
MILCRYYGNVTGNVCNKFSKVGINMTTYTIKDIAKLAGVGVSTLTRALNNHPDINKTTKDKINYN